MQRLCRWEYLTEKLAYERRVRESKIKAAMIQAKRVNAEFAEMVERNRVDQHIQERKRKRNSDAPDNDGSNAKQQPVRSFRQARPLSSTHGSAGSKVKTDTLRSVFASK
jgi:hypothetical protein